MKLKDKVALITGAGSGIGAAAARMMAAEGAAVAAVGIPPRGVAVIAAEIKGAGGRAVGMAADVSEADQVEAAVARTVEAFGKLDILVPNAGVQMHREDVSLETLPEAVWDRTHDINYRGQYLTCKYGLAQMLRQGSGGVITLVSSITALSGFSKNVAYATGKAGLINLARHIAVHYGSHGIRCNSICPGALEVTPDHGEHPDPQGRASSMAEKIPLGRLGRPEEIASFITFLAGDDASYASGANFVIDGGFTVS